MGKRRLWAFWRRLQYGTGFFTMLGLASGLVYMNYFYTPDNCFDSMMNSDETGVDCGGTCVLICAAEVTPPRIIWAKSFKISDGQYNAVAYIENSNEVASTPELHYKLQLFDGDKVVAERTGITVLPPNSVYPVFEGRIAVDTKQVTDTKLTIEPAKVWLPALIGREQFKTSNLNLTGADARPRLAVTLENTELTTAKNVEVVATLFDDSGEAVTASQTFVDSLDARSTKDIVFTWPQSIAKTIRSCIIPTDVVLGIDLSGSMNNDSNNPPQPVTDALAAAKIFAAGMNQKDQAGIVTFATEASNNVLLNKDHTNTASVVGNLSIDPKEETGYTNTSAAFLAALTELNSERHNQDARRVFVLLTDGMPTAKGDTVEVVEETRQAAAKLTAEGVEIYAIGLGKGVNLDFISTIVADKTHAYHAPTTADLATIYTEITASLCESGTARIDVIAKTPTNFPPLR